MNTQWTIYALTDPRTQAVRYVGFTYCIKRRFSEHLHDKARTHKANWVRHLLSLGLKPLMIVLETGNGEEGRITAERNWIAYYKAAGVEITNLTDGGDGAPGHIKSEATRRKLSAAFKGKPRPREVMERVRKTKMERGQTNKQLAALRLVSLRNIGRKRSLETLQRMSACRIGKAGKPMSLENRKLMSEFHKGIPKTLEQREKMRAAATKRYQQEGQSMFRSNATYEDTTRQTQFSY